MTSWIIKFHDQLKELFDVIFEPQADQFWMKRKQVAAEMVSCGYTNVGSKIDRYLIDYLSFLVFKPSSLGQIVFSSIVKDDNVMKYYGSLLENKYPDIPLTKVISPRNSFRKMCAYWCDNELPERSDVEEAIRDWNNYSSIDMLWEAVRQYLKRDIQFFFNSEYAEALIENVASYLQGDIDKVALIGDSILLQDRVLESGKDTIEYTNVSEFLDKTKNSTEKYLVICTNSEDKFNIGKTTVKDIVIINRKSLKKVSGWKMEELTNLSKNSVNICPSQDKVKTYLLHRKLSLLQKFKQRV